MIRHAGRARRGRGANAERGSNIDRTGRRRGGDRRGAALVAAGAGGSGDGDGGGAHEPGASRRLVGRQFTMWQTLEN